MNGSNPSARKAHELREAFDRSFAQAASPGTAAELDFLEIRVAGDQYALRLSEVLSLHAGRKLTAAPSLLPELLGMAGFHGALAPVYDLAALLGYDAQPGSRWLVLAAHASLIGFAFESFDAQLGVTLDCVSGSVTGAGESSHGTIHSGGRTLPLLHLPSLVEAIARRITALGPVQER